MLLPRERKWDRMRKEGCGKPKKNSNNNKSYTWLSTVSTNSNETSRNNNDKRKGGERRWWLWEKKTAAKTDSTFQELRDDTSNKTMGPLGGKSFKLQAWGREGVVKFCVLTCTSRPVDAVTTLYHREKLRREKMGDKHTQIYFRCDENNIFLWLRHFCCCRSHETPYMAIMNLLEH